MKFGIYIFNTDYGKTRRLVAIAKSEKYVSQLRQVAKNTIPFGSSEYVSTVVWTI